MIRTAMAALALAAAMPARGAERSALDDRQYLHAVQAANDAEIEAAELALEKAQREDVKDFARMMIERHGDLKEEVASYIENKNIRVYPGQATRDIKAQASTAYRNLKRTPPAAFDDAYMKAQIEAHRHVLGVLDEALSGTTTLKPQAQDLLKKARGSVQSHLSRAEELASRRLESED